MKNIFRLLYLFILGIFYNVSNDTKAVPTVKKVVKQVRRNGSLARAMKNAGKQYSSTKGFALS